MKSASGFERFDWPKMKSTNQVTEFVKKIFFPIEFSHLIGKTVFSIMK